MKAGPESVTPSMDSPALRALLTAANMELRLTIRLLELIFPFNKAVYFRSNVDVEEIRIRSGNEFDVLLSLLEIIEIARLYE